MNKTLASATVHRYYLGMKWLKHAFAIDPPESVQPNAAQQQLVEKICAEIVRRRLTTPALMLLEMSRPLNYVSAQFLHFVQPFASAIVDREGYRQLTEFLEHRGSIEYICKRLEAADEAD